MKKIKICTCTWLLLLSAQIALAQRYVPHIEEAKLIKTDPRLIVKSGYLIVPEDRSQPAGRQIRIPFVFVRRPDQDPRKNILLFTTGGPGYSTIANIDSIDYNSGWLMFGGFIAFDQRGTRLTDPQLPCPEVDTAIRTSYLTNQNREMLVHKAVEGCRIKLQKQGINLGAYTTVASAEDINDLRLALNLDSLYLLGISYSGGLMLTVARRHPEAVRALILNSPLPEFVNYEEEALYNINTALDQVFANCADSAIVYHDLKARFRSYFTGITGRKFKLPYQAPGQHDSVMITYTKHELLDAIIDRMNTAQVKTVPAVILDIINGHHASYVREVLNGYFGQHTSLSLGMRYSVYCSEQIAYADQRVIHDQEKKFPWLAGFRFNNVDHAICNCWKVPAEPAAVKTPRKLSVPALIAAGDIDPWCPAYYGRLIEKKLPNAQLLIRHNAGHVPGFMIDGVDYVGAFIKNPYKKLVSHSKNARLE
jgi:pimeloyl-ACP methyl ester carboxylesterase